MSKISTLFMVTFLMISLGCFRKTKSTQLEASEEKLPKCGVKDSGDLRDMAGQNPPTVFKAKCATCHHYSKDGTGPALRGFMKKAPSEEWFKSFIRNQDELIEAGDSLAMEIQKQKPTKGLHYHNLTDKEFDQLIEYLK
ncbi:MAG: cytochrome c [bacterium]|nr:cytochrome c [bacterium]